MSLFQIARPRRRRRLRRLGERRAGSERAHCGSPPRGFEHPSKEFAPNSPEPPGAGTPSPARPLSRCRSHRRRARAWPQMFPAAAPSSNYEGSTGAECARPASEVRPPPAEPFTPPLFLALSGAPLGAPLSPTHTPLLVHPTHPQTSRHTTRYSVVPPNRGRRMKILIKNLSSSMTQGPKDRCFHPRGYLVFVPSKHECHPHPGEKPQKCKPNNFFGRL